MHLLSSCPHVQSCSCVVDSWIPAEQRSQLISACALKPSQTGRFQTCYPFPTACAMGLARNFQSPFSVSDLLHKGKNKIL